MFGMMGAIAAPEIASIVTASGFTTILDVSADPLHETLSGGQAYGLWIDSPLIPYRTDGGFTVFLTGSQVTYRYLVTSNVWTSANIAMNPGNAVRASANTGVQFDYDHRIWVFGVYASGLNVYGIGHHEWYVDRYTVDGHDGYNNQPNHKWVTTPIWIKSTSNGSQATWATKTYTPWTSGAANTHRLFLVPEAWATQSYDTLYGWQHPSNIVYPPDIGQTDDPYYYSFIDANNLVGAADTLLDIGFILIRWSDLEDPETTQFWNGSGWTTRASAAQGNNAAQQPYVFFELTGHDPYTSNPKTDRMAQSVRWHWPTQQWLLFGYDSRNNPSLCFLRSKTLANPKFEVNGVNYIPYTGGGTNADYLGNSYISVFDPDATDQNFTSIGNSPLLVVADDYIIYKKQTLTINVV